MPEPQPHVAIAWRDYRARRNQVVTLLAGLLGVFVIQFFLEDASLASRLAWWLISALFALCAVAGWRFTYWPCPRCRDFFNVSSWLGLAGAGRWPDRCMHCGLSVDESWD